jgi:hypothetical protein
MAVTRHFWILNAMNAPMGLSHRTLRFAASLTQSNVFCLATFIQRSLRWMNVAKQKFDAIPYLIAGRRFRR